MLRYAAENGYDKVAWTTGAQQANIWSSSLRGVVDKVELFTLDNGNTYVLNGSKNNVSAISQPVTLDKLHEYVGASIAKDLIAQVNADPGQAGGKIRAGTVSGENIVVGGEFYKILYDMEIPDFLKRYAKKWGARVGETELVTGNTFNKKRLPSGEYEVFDGAGVSRGVFYGATEANSFINELKANERGTPSSVVHSIEITDAMRTSVLAGQPLFQEGARGAIEFNAESKAILHAFKQADLTTAIHEGLGHVFRRDLMETAEMAIDPSRKTQLQADVHEMTLWAGLDTPQQWAEFETLRLEYDALKARAKAKLDMTPEETARMQEIAADVTRYIDAEEMVAKGFEEYLKEGKAPTPGLASVFAQFKSWLMELYSWLRGQKLVELSPEMRQIFDRMFTDDASKPPLLAEQMYDVMPGGQLDMFKAEQTMPLFTGTAMKGEESVFAPKEQQVTQIMPGMEEAYKPQMKGAVEIINPLIKNLEDHINTLDGNTSLAISQYYSGDKNVVARQQLIEALTGLVPAKSKAGVGVLENAYTEWKAKQVPQEGMFAAKPEVAPAYSKPVEQIGNYIYYKNNYGELYRAPVGSPPDVYSGMPIGRWEASASTADMRLEMLRNPPRRIVQAPLYQTDWFKTEMGDRRVLYQTAGKDVNIGDRVQVGGTEYIIKAKIEGGMVECELVQNGKPAGNITVAENYLKALAAKAEPIVQSSNGQTYEMPVEQPVPKAVGTGLGTTEAATAQPPTTAMQEEGWNTWTKPLLDAMKPVLTREPQGRTGAGVLEGLDPAAVKELRKWLGSTYYPHQNDAKLASIRWGENRRDAALLNYTRRYGFDNVLAGIMPYEFWTTRSMLNWAWKAFDRPVWFANYARVKEFQRKTMAPNGFPTRLRGKMKFPIPFMPEWMGGGIYFDPLKQLFPMEQIMRAFTTMATQQTTEMRRAQQLLTQYAEDGEITQAEAQEALATRKGAVWDKAMAQAVLDTEGEVQNPIDFAGLMVGWSLPVQWGLEYLKGTPEHISPLPITRVVQNVTSGLGLNKGRGFNLEGPIRRALGMPEGDRFADYRVDRMLSILAAEGKIDAQTAQMAMMDRGKATDPAVQEAFLMAQQRVAQEGRWKYLGAPFAVDIFPEGEQEIRALSVEYGKARDAWLAGGEYDKTIGAFFEEYPEYEARLTSFQSDPAERLRYFLRSQIWDAWGKASTLVKREMQDKLGPVFNDNFLNKELRAYDTIDTETYVQWAKMLNATVPASAPTVPQVPFELPAPETQQLYDRYESEKNKLFPNISKLNTYYGKVPDAELKKYFPQLDKFNQWKNAQLAAQPELIPFVIGTDAKVAGASPEIQALYYQFQSAREQQFPGVFELQDAYFRLVNTKDKDAFLTQNPTLTQYWDWRRSFLTQYPNMIPYVVSEASLAESVLGVNPYNQAVATVAPIDLGKYSPALLRQLLGYFMANQELTAGALALLRYDYINSGSTLTFDEWMNLAVKPVIME
jgi:hypothetical protein